MSDGPGYMATAKVIADAAVRKSDRNAIIEECVWVAQQWLIRAAQGSGEDLIDAIEGLKDKS